MPADARPGTNRNAQETSAVSGLLRAWSKGDAKAREKLMPLVYEELRRRAAAYLRLIGQERVVWQNRAHFYGVAAQMMRRILVDHARGHGRGKRFGAAVR